MTGIRRRDQRTVPDRTEQWRAAAGEWTILSDGRAAVCDCKREKISGTVQLADRQQSKPARGFTYDPAASEMTRDLRRRPKHNRSFEMARTPQFARSCARDPMNARSYGLAQQGGTPPFLSPRCAAFNEEDHWSISWRAESSTTVAIASAAAALAPPQAHAGRLVVAVVVLVCITVSWW